jgi:hypothetical protein
MLRLGRKKATSSLCTLRRKITLETLARLQPILLLPMVVGISQTVNSRVSRSQTLARSLLLGGQQRLHDLLASAPRLHLSVDQILEFCRRGDAGHTPEEAAAQALLEVCLGLILQWMTENDRRHRTSATVSRRPRVSPSYFPLCSSRRPPRTRSCLYTPLSR